MLVTRAWVETPLGLLIRVTVNVDDGRVTCRMDAGVPAFDAPPVVMRALARALEGAAATADDLRSVLATPVPDQKLIHNPDFLAERLGHLLPEARGRGVRSSVSRRKSA